MTAEGFVLAGGRSARMGSDKAALLVDGLRLLERTAREVEAAAGRVTIIAPADRYPGLPWLVLPDRRAGCGPLAGIETALLASDSEWSLITAVDMPGLRRGFLHRLLDAVRVSDADCLLPESAPGRVEPLCAVYRRTCLAAVQQALDAGARKVTDALSGLQVIHFPIDNQENVVNINSPEDWRGYLERRRG